MTPYRLAAIVPMKGHSERVPGKNLRPLAGDPLYAYILRSLFGCDLVDKVFVDTDDRSLADAVLQRFPDVAVIDRPAELHGDLVPMNDVLMHDAAVIDAEWCLQTHTTNPLLSSATIGRAIEALLGGDADHDSLMAVTPLQSRLWWGPNRPVNHDPRVLLRTQDLPPVFEENSNLYVFRRTQMLDTGSRIGANPLFFPMGRIESWDIDEEEDFLIAEALVARRRRG